MIDAAIRGRCLQSGQAYHSALILMVAAIVFVVGSWLAFTQAPRPDPYVPPIVLDHFFHPIEDNTFQRLPNVSVNLNGVFVFPDSRLAWAVGDEGLILHSRGGGWTWARRSIGEAESDQTQKVSGQENGTALFRVVHH